VWQGLPPHHSRPIFRSGRYKGIASEILFASSCRFCASRKGENMKWKPGNLAGIPEGQRDEYSTTRPDCLYEQKQQWPREQRRSLNPRVRVRLKPRALGWCAGRPSHPATPLYLSNQGEMKAGGRPLEARKKHAIPSGVVQDAGPRGVDWESCGGGRQPAGAGWWWWWWWCCIKVRKITTYKGYRAGT
jgi:hypothetical protein